MPQPTTSLKAVDQLSYPVLRFVRGMVFPARCPSDLNECSKVALRSGFFEGQLLVDAQGCALVVRSAKKVHGVGPFWGYNIFLNQRIKVDLVVDSARPLTIEQVREKTLKSIAGNQQWDASADAESLRAEIKRAATIHDIAVVVTDAYFRRY